MMQLALTPPIVALTEISVDEANRWLVAWRHKMGPLERPHFSADRAYGLVSDDGLCAVATTSTLIRENVAARPDLTRETTIELSRLCASRPALCRVLLRLWREFVFPSCGYPAAISYQDAKLHTGDLYRFDGWVRVSESRSGPDRRSGTTSRSKVIWGWPPVIGEARP